MSISYSNKANSYKELSKELKSDASSILVPYVGGISKSDMSDNTANSDRVSPSFRRRGMNNTEG